MVPLDPQFPLSTLFLCSRLSNARQAPSTVHMATLDDEDFSAGAREIGARDETVVTPRQR
jgi:hypothetical protein